MAGFLFAFVAMIAMSLGARDQVLIARLAPRKAALFVALASTALSCALAGWAGQRVAPLMDGPTRAMLAAIVVAIAGLELVLVRPGRAPLEPTQSLGALFLVLLAQQLTDAARFALFAIAAASPLPHVAVAGAILGCSASLTAAWLAGAAWEKQPLQPVRRALGVILIAVASWIALPLLMR